jgi:hypothetical protein
VVPFLHVTTRIEGRENDDLLRRKAKRAVFPTIILMDGAGEPLYTFDRVALSAWLAGGPIPMEVFARKLDACERYLALAARARAGDDVEVELALAAAAIGRIDVAELEARLQGAELTPAQAKTVRQLRVNAVCDRNVALLRTPRGNRPEEFKRITREFVELYRSGTQPDCDSAITYWWVIAYHGAETRDADLLEAGLRAIKAWPGGEARYDSNVGPWEKLLAELRAK